MTRVMGFPKKYNCMYIIERFRTAISDKNIEEKLEKKGMDREKETEKIKFRQKQNDWPISSLYPCPLPCLRCSFIMFSWHHELSLLHHTLAPWCSCLTEMDWILWNSEPNWTSYSLIIEIWYCIPSMRMLMQIPTILNWTVTCSVVCSNHQTELIQDGDWILRDSLELGMLLDGSKCSINVSLINRYVQYEKQIHLSTEQSTFLNAGTEDWPLGSGDMEVPWSSCSNQACLFIATHPCAPSAPCLSPLLCFTNLPPDWEITAVKPWYFYTWSLPSSNPWCHFPILPFQGDIFFGDGGTMPPMTARLLTDSGNIGMW